MTARPFLYLSLLCALPLSASGGLTLDAMEPAARETALATMRLTDAYWDDRAAFLWNAPQAPAVRHHQLRETIMYAFGLLMRGGSGDREKAIRAIEGVLDNQIVDDPTESYYGTFQRYPEEPRPPHRYLAGMDSGGLARIFVEYDPNWREFVGDTLIMILEEYSNQLPEPLRRRIEESIGKAVEGERKEGRLEKSYTNPTLRDAARPATRRRALGLSVSKAAEILRVRRATLSDLLRGKAALTPEMALRIEKAFGPDMNHLLRMRLAYQVAKTRDRAREIVIKRYVPV